LFFFWQLRSSHGTCYADIRGSDEAAPVVGVRAAATAAPTTKHIYKGAACRVMDTDALLKRQRQVRADPSSNADKSPPQKTKRSRQASDDSMEFPPGFLHLEPLLGDYMRSLGNDHPKALGALKEFDKMVDVAKRLMSDGVKMFNAGRTLIIQAQEKLVLDIKKLVPPVDDVVPPSAPRARHSPADPSDSARAARASRRAAASVAPKAAVDVSILHAVSVFPFFLFSFFFVSYRLIHSSLFFLLYLL